MSNNENSVIEYLKTNNEVLFDKIVNALRKGKQVNFTDINQSDILILSPQKAFEYAGEEGDKYFKVWMVGSTIAWCTWANSMVDSDFRWNAKAQVKKLIDRLSHLVEDVAEYFAPAPPIPILGPLLKSMDEEDYRRCRTEFDTKLMRLKCLDEHNKMIPYFEKKAEEWDYKKAGLLGKIAKVLKK